ncbi:MAG: hypothetical protein Q7K21_00215 [Elusimicrobiota bacterium]|nr:hypothetical protein [Elusimicrobiota bacterium]
MKRYILYTFKGNELVRDYRRELKNGTGLSATDLLDYYRKKAKMRMVKNK